MKKDPFETTETYRQLWPLLSKLAEDDLAENEVQPLRELLANSDQARRYYVQYLDTHAQLTGKWGSTDITFQEKQNSSAPVQTWSSLSTPTDHVLVKPLGTPWPLRPHRRSRGWLFFDVRSCESGRDGSRNGYGGNIRARRHEVSGVRSRTTAGTS